MPEWRHCSRGSPCLVCGESRRCSIHVSGETGFCRTPEANPHAAPRFDKTGQPAWLWNLLTLGEKGGHRPLVTQRACAEDQVLDSCYRAWLRCGLTDPHLQMICRRYGVAWDRRHTLPLGDYVSISRLDTQSVIRQTVLNSLSETVLSIPGIYQTANNCLELVPRAWKQEGILVANRNAEGLITALTARFDDPRHGRYTMVSSARHGGAGPRAAIHFPDDPRTTDSTIRITEGQIKASVATYLTDTLTLSLPGASSWQALFPVLRRLCHVRRIVLAYDMDAYINPYVARSLHELTQEIARSATEYELAVEVWEPAYKGIDDLLVAGGTPTVHEGDAAQEMVAQIARAAGLELEEERFESIVREVAAKKDGRLIADPAVMEFCAGLDTASRYLWDAEMRAALGTDYRNTQFWQAVQSVRRRHGTTVQTVRREDDTLPIIETYSRPTAVITQDAVNAIYSRNDPPRVFYWGNSVARLHKPTHDAEYEIQILDTGSLKSELERKAYWQKTVTSRAMQVACPLNTVMDLLSYPEMWNGLPRIDAVVSYPVFDYEGHLVEKPGFNQSSRMVLSTQQPPTIPELPKFIEEKEIQEAKNLLDYLLTDFHFANLSSRAYAFSLFLLQPARFLIKDITPFYVIDAPMAGVGKGKLYSVLTKAWIPKQGISTQVPTNDAEWDKRLLAALSKSSTHLMFDNVTTRLEAAPLASALTSNIYSSRILGVSRMADIPVHCIWAATGNNIEASEEIERRIVQIRLDTDTEYPSLRQDFAIPNIVEWVVAHRNEIIRAGLIMVKAWLDRGRPLADRTLGSYEEWSQVMGGILKVCGIEGFLSELRTRTATEAPWAEFIYRWYQMYGTERVVIHQLLPLIDHLDLGLTRGSKEHDEPGKQLGWALVKRTDTISAGRKIRSAETIHGQRAYKLEICNLERHNADIQKRIVDS